MTGSTRRDANVLGEWYSTAKLFDLNPATATILAFRFGLIISVICAKEGQVEAVIDLQEREFVKLCRSMRECIKEMPPEALVAELAGMDPFPATHSSKGGPWGRRHK